MMYSKRNAPANWLDKIAQILESTATPTIASAILQKCGLDSHGWNWYKELLLTSGMLDVYPLVNVQHSSGMKKHRVTYQTSTRGKEWLQAYYALTSMLNPKASPWQG